MPLKYYYQHIQESFASFWLLFFTFATSPSVSLNNVSNGVRKLICISHIHISLLFRFRSAWKSYLAKIQTYFSVFLPHIKFFCLAVFVWAMVFFFNFHFSVIASFVPYRISVSRTHDSCQKLLLQITCDSKTNCFWLLPEIKTLLLFDLLKTFNQISWSFAFQFKIPIEFVSIKLRHVQLIICFRALWRNAKSKVAS